MQGTGGDAKASDPPDISAPEEGVRRPSLPRSQSRARRRAFPGTSTPRPLPELPDEPLPPEPSAAGETERGPGSPIVLVPIGAVDEAVLELLRSPVEEVYGRRTEVSECLPMPKYAFNPTRGQYHSSAILKRVESALLDDWDSAVGITEADLFVPEVPFIFGEADRSSRSALISLRRLRPEGSGFEPRRDQLHRRFISEVIHQVGMLRGLAHCPNNRCVMFAAEAVSEIDKRGSTLCANCRKRLIVA